MKLTTTENLINGAMLCAAVATALIIVVPQSTLSSATHSGLQRVFSDQYHDFSSQDSTKRISSLSELEEALQRVVDCYYTAPVISAGWVRHLVYNNSVLNPTLIVGYRSQRSSAITEVSSPILFGVSVHEAVAALAAHPTDCFVTIGLVVRFAALSAASSMEEWEGTWTGEVDVHHSFMNFAGSLVRVRSQRSLERLMALPLLWVLLCLASWYSRRSLAVSMSSFVHICGAVLVLMTQLESGAMSDTLISAQKLSVALACFSSCVLISWGTLEKFSCVFVVQRALSVAATHLWWYGVGVMPLVFAFAVAATSLFAFDDEHFGTIPRSMVTLFCTVFGDSLLDTFTTMDERGDTLTWWVLSRLYFLTFLVLFITNILNVALSVIQDAVSVAEQTLSESNATGDETETPIDAILELLASS